MLRTRFYLGILPLLLLLIAMGGAAAWLLRAQARAIEMDLVANYRTLIGCYQLRDAANAMTDALFAIRGGDPLAAGEAFRRHEGLFQRHLLEQSVGTADEDRTQLLEKLDDAFTTMRDHGVRMLREGSLGALDAFQEAEVNRFRTLKAIETLSERDFVDAQAAVGRARGLVRLSIQVIVGVMVLAVLLSVYLSYRLARSLMRPIQALTSSALALGDGDLDHDVPVTSRDELGELARTFNAMAARLRTYREAMTQRALRAHRVMEATLAATPDPLFIVDRGGRHEVRNPAADTLAAEVDFSEGFPSPLNERLAAALAEGAHYLPIGYDQVVTVRVRGEDRHYLPRIFVIGDELTGFGGAAVVLNDVTKFRLLDDVKTNLVSTVSHELKTPLTSLRLAVYLLIEQNFGPLNDRQRDLLETARDDADRLLRLLNNLLDLSRLESGVSQLVRIELPVDQLLERMAREMRSLVDAAGQTLRVEATSAAGTVSVDPDRIRHVFSNLIGNASKYAPMGSTITLLAEAAPDDFVRLVVRDEGAGVPEESLPHIFERFYRVPGATVKGAGLGLTIAREIVVAHGGSISAMNRANGGCDFSVVLPRRAP